MTVAELASRYLEAARIKLKPRTMKATRSYLKCHLLPAFGGLDAGEVRRAEVIQWHTSLRRMPATADRSLAILSGIFRHGIERGLVFAPNPCAGVRRWRKRANREAAFLNAAAYARLGVALRAERHQDAACLIGLLALTGMRVSEALSALWTDYRAEHLHLRDAKAGPRIVFLSSPARAILDNRERLSVWIFPARARGGKLRAHKHMGYEAVREAWLRVRREAGLPQGFRIHDLRHSYASTAVELGESEVAIQKLLGHRDHASTAIYMHTRGLEKYVEIIGYALAGR